MTTQMHFQTEGNSAAGGYSIAFEDVAKSYGGRPVVEDVDFRVAPGEFLTILGPSGSGKTTLLMLIAGFINPEQGRILLGDRDISQTPPYKRDIGVVFQSYALFPHMNVYDNVAYPLKARGLSRAEQKRRVEWALERVHMGAFSTRAIGQLSGGQQQRIALARAICFDPAALLMDEPLAALDRNLRGEMQTEIRNLQRSLGQTVIFVTHDQDEALAMSDRILVMGEGRIQQIDTPQELYLHPRNEFVARFFGEANLMAGKAQAEGFQLAGCRVPLPATGSRSGTTLCLRPEVLRLDHVGSGPSWALPARVTEVQRLGSTERINLSTADGTWLATRMVDGRPSPAKTGETVDLSWSTELSHLLED